MEEIIKRIPLDINAESNQQVVFLRHMESGRRVEFILNQSGRPYYVENDKRAFVSGKRPDDLKFNNAAEISNGHVFYEITRQNTSAVGTVEAELRIFGGDDELLISAPFKFEVSETIYNDGDEPIDTPEATALTQLITDATEAINKAKASTINSAEVSMTDNGGEAAAAVELIQEEDGQKIKFLFENLEGKDGRDGVDGISPTITMFKNGQRLSIIVNDVNGESEEYWIYDGMEGFSPTASVKRSGRAAVISVTDKSGETSASIFDGADGVSPVIDVSKEEGIATLTITDASGVKEVKLEDGEAGSNGKSIFILDIINPTGTNMGFSANAVLNGDRPVQTGDLLLSNGNGRVYQVTELIGTTIVASYTGITVFNTGDILNDNGVIKQERLPEGYPYPAEGGNVILPATSLTFDDSNNAFVLKSGLDASMFVSGASYTVNWNGTDYETQAIATELDGVKMICLGDFGVMAGETSTDEPFIIAVFESSVHELVGFAAGFIPKEPTEQITVSISDNGGGTTRIDHKYLPAGYPYEERIEGVILPETTTRSLTAVDMQMDNLIVGESYHVMIDGTEYVTTCKLITSNGETGNCLGNAVNYGYPDTGEPFVLFPIADGSGTMVFANITGSFTLSISGPSMEVHPMAYKFMPGATEKDVAVHISDIDGVNINPTFDELKSAIYAGKIISHREGGSSRMKEYHFSEFNDVNGNDAHITFERIELNEDAVPVLTRKTYSREADTFFVTETVELGGANENQQLEALIETDTLPAVRNADGAILTVSGKNVLLRY